MASIPDPVRRAVVLADVAAAAGVSSQTVSRVLNGERWVAEATRARVLEAAQRLNYRPNRAARTLATQRSRSLGVVGLDEALFTSVSPLISFERAARAAGYNLNVASVTDMDERSIGAAFDTLSELSVDGVLMAAPGEDVVEPLRRFSRRVPTVAVEVGPSAGVPTVGLDQRGAARSAVEHLLSLGHQRIGHVSGPLSRLESRERLEGWREALHAAGVCAPDPWPGDWSPESGYAAGLRYLQQCDIEARDVTAVFVACDRMALGFMRALHVRGVRIPDEVSVVGFDDVPDAAYFTPALTTVRQSFTEIGEACLDLLLARMADPDGPPEHRTVGTRLVVRESTASRCR